MIIKINICKNFNSLNLREKNVSKTNFMIIKVKTHKNFII